jgi:hypothetical protein
MNKSKFISILSAVAMTLVAVPALADATTGVTSVAQRDGVVYIDFNAPAAGKLEVISGTDVYQVNITAGQHHVGIPASEISDMLADRNDDIFMLRAEDGSALGTTGVRVTARQPGAREHSPYLAYYIPGDHPDAEAQRQLMSTIPQ